LVMLADKIRTLRRWGGDEILDPDILSVPTDFAR
jgi:hypothetical protein